jgi:hypothetical protein
MDDVWSEVLDHLADADPSLAQEFLVASEALRAALPGLLRPLVATAEETKEAIGSFTARVRAERIAAGLIDSEEEPDD